MILTNLVLSLAELVYMRDLAALREQQPHVVRAGLVRDADQHGRLRARLHGHWDGAAVQHRALLRQRLREGGLDDGGGEAAHPVRTMAE